MRSLYHNSDPVVISPRGMAHLARPYGVHPLQPRCVHYVMATSVNMAVGVSGGSWRAHDKSVGEVLKSGTPRFCSDCMSGHWERL